MARTDDLPRRGRGAAAELLGDLRRSRLTFAIIVAGIALQALFVVAHGINAWFLGDGLFLALDRDPNLPSWVETALFVVGGLACWLLAWLKPAVRGPWVLLGIAAFLLSMEQMVQLHGDIERDLGSVVTTVIQPLMALGLIVVVVLAARGVPRLSQVLLWGAIGAIAVAQGASTLNNPDLPHAAIVLLQTIEELGELTTATLLIAAPAQPFLDGVVERVLREHGRIDAALR